MIILLFNINPKFIYSLVFHQNIRETETIKKLNKIKERKRGPEF